MASGVICDECGALVPVTELHSGKSVWVRVRLNVAETYTEETECSGIGDFCSRKCAAAWVAKNLEKFMPYKVTK